MVCVVIGAASYLLPFSDITVSLSASFCYAPGEMANCHQQSLVKWVVKIRLATMERKKTGQLEIKGGLRSPQRGLGFKLRQFEAQTKWIKH
ncbi:hypothetical protein CDAR_24101 [Caerostris darwini]|uniref:Uncharacterized protein n=1 Tax=Caerostris darwini TaxID=1538125 RepID=A0AAV4QKV7_9ARAC|nr:hypothetical protein CDAR_24101 [Caerostris darwini]